eukprot:5390172-Amphidinium_carterae.1
MPYPLASNDNDMFHLLWPSARTPPVFHIKFVQPTRPSRSECNRNMTNAYLPRRVSFKERVLHSYRFMPRAMAEHAPLAASAIKSCPALSESQARA